jgi:hypothetical protein
MNESVGMLSRAKGRAAKIISDTMVSQGENGVKYCVLFLLSESKIPLELMREDAE